MKLQMGYFDKDGRYIGRKLDTSRRKKYYVVMGTLRKKISEHEDQSPYRTHQHLVPYSKNYSDRTRILMQLDEYENGRKKQEIKFLSWRYSDPDYERTHTLIKRIKEHIHANARRFINNDSVEIIYYPDGSHLDIEERRRR
jgi:hypothetical protein